MTTDIELLPLVGTLGAMPEHVQGVVQAYARANVAHATAAKDAEIEALRSEVELQRELSAQHAREAVFWERKHVDSVSRAERLAEALQASLEAVQGALQEAYHSAGQECCGRGGMYGCCGAPEAVWTPEDQAVMDKLAPIQRLLNAALRDHDQEVG